MLQTNFDPFPELHTPRLLLRKLKKDDAPQLFVLRSDERVMQFIDRPRAKSVIEMEPFIEQINENAATGNSVLWAICLKEDPGTLIGTICFWHIDVDNYRTETGYLLHPEHWRKGIMKEAILSILDYGFNKMKLHSVEARFTPGNIASEAVLLSTGFVKEAHFRENVFYIGQFFDTVVYSRLI